MRRFMRKKRFIFLALCMLTLLSSCWKQRKEEILSERIDEIWQECETSVPEAEMMAEAMKNYVQSSTEYVKQKYDLLNIRIRDKKDMVPSSPDSAWQAKVFFEKRGNLVDKERVYYYLGSAYRDLKDYPRAVNYFLKAVESAEKCKSADTLIWQNSLSQLANLYMLQLNYEEELSVALQVVELARQTGIKLGWHLMDVATAYNQLNDTTHCVQYCDQAYNVYQQEKFPPKYAGSYAYMLAIYSKYQHYDKVEELLLYLQKVPEYLRPNNYELCLAKYHENANRMDSALIHYNAYYNRINNLSGRYEASAGLQRCYLQMGDFKEAALWGSRLYKTNDSIIAQRAFEQTERARDAFHYYRDKEKEQAIIKRDEHIIFIATVTCLVFLCIVLGLVAFYNFRRKKYMEEIIGKDQMLKSVKDEILRRQNQLKKKQNEIEQLGDQLNDAEQTIATSKIQLENTMKDLEQRTMINRELTRIALMNNATTKAEDVIAYFRKVATGKATLNDNAWVDLIAAVETLYPGFQEKVQGRLKRQMREPLLHTIYLLKIGLKPIQITKVMNAKMQTVWNRVKRAEELCSDLLSV